MRIKGIIDEDFVNYKQPSMIILFPHCNWKCGRRVCQNGTLSEIPDIDINITDLYNRYRSNHISKAVVCGGLEPFDDFEDLFSLISYFRECGCTDDIVVYTGYTEEELAARVRVLRRFCNIIIKFGRYIDGEERHFDPVLGVNLASRNQYAKVLGGSDENKDN